MLQSDDSTASTIQNMTKSISTDNLTLIQTYSQKAIDGIITFAPKLLLALAIVVIGLWIAKKITFASEHHCCGAQVSPRDQ